MNYEIGDNHEPHDTPSESFGDSDLDPLASYGGVTANNDRADVPDDVPEEYLDSIDPDLTDVERAEMAFNFRVAMPPSPAELAELQQNEDAIDWLGFVGRRSPIEVTFGQEDSIAEIRHAASPTPTKSDRLSPEQSDAIVDRQLTDYVSTLLRIQESIQATAVLADLAAKHQGRSAVWRIDMVESMYGPGTILTNRHMITPDPDLGVRIEEYTPPNDWPDDVVRMNTADGETHLIAKDGSFRIRVGMKEGRMMVIKEQKFTVEPDDATYLTTLNRDLTAYRGLLLEVAEFSGFDPDDIFDPETGQVNVDFLLSNVGPVIASDEHRLNLPSNLRTRLEVYAQAIAARVNPTYQDEDNLSERAFRVGGYFHQALGRSDS